MDGVNVPVHSVLDLGYPCCAVNHRIREQNKRNMNLLRQRCKKQLLGIHKSHH